MVQVASSHHWLVSVELPLLTMMVDACPIGDVETCLTRSFVSESTTQAVSHVFLPTSRSNHQPLIAISFFQAAGALCPSFPKSILDCCSFLLTEISRNHQLPISTSKPEQDVCYKILMNTVSVFNSAFCSRPQSSPSLERFHLPEFDSRL
jgi:hypothetical protein